MDSESIYALLQSKNHNQHYLARYWKFIQWCQARQTTDEYAESHHILPKAKDLFPEYADVKKFKWNSVDLTAREHIMAHIMLWKAYGGSQTASVFYMLNIQNENTGYNKRNVPTTLLIRYAAKTREEQRKIRLGKSVFKDPAGNKFLLSVDDPKIAELSLVGNNSGLRHNDETKEKMKRSKDHSRLISLWFLNIETRVPMTSDKYAILLEQGWLPYKTPEAYEYGMIIFSEKVSAKLKGTMRYMTPDGVFFGRLSFDDPRIAELGLLPQKTEKSVSAAIENVLKASQANIGRKTYNNGTIEKRFHSDPGGEWRLGRLPRIGEYRTKHASATSTALRGTVTWNDGVRCYRIKPGQVPEEGWVKGMIKRK